MSPSPPRPFSAPGFGPGSDILDKFGIALVGKLVERAMLRHRKISAREINRIGEEGGNFTLPPRKVYVIRKPNVGLPVFSRAKGFGYNYKNGAASDGYSCMKNEINFS